MEVNIKFSLECEELDHIGISAELRRLVQELLDAGAESKGWKIDDLQLLDYGSKYSEDDLKEFFEDFTTKDLNAGHWEINTITFEDFKAIVKFFSE